MSTLKEELQEQETLLTTLCENKVANFAYTDKAYTENDMAGVKGYDVDKEQNIPVADHTVLQVNETVLKKGYRSKASSITRMLMNHFLGRTSYNLNKVTDLIKNLHNILLNSFDVAYGIPLLNEEKRIPYSMLPESSMEFYGTWDASTNTPDLENLSPKQNQGTFLVVSVTGTYKDVKYFANDRIIWDEKQGDWIRLVGNVLKAPIGMIYQQLYNPTKAEWESSPLDLYPNNEWEDITSDFADYPYMKIQDGTVTEGHVAEHNHFMWHKHRMEHSHGMGHNHTSYVWNPQGSGATTASNRYTMIANANNRGGATLSGTSGWSSKTSTDSGSYSSSYTGNSVTFGSTTSAQEDKKYTDNQGSGKYPEPNSTSVRIWKCIQ